MSTVRIQVRRGTAAQWTSVDPVLEAGEMGLETDTNYIKFGNGTDVWSDLGYANDPGFLDLTNSLVNYVEVADIGAVSGVAGLDSSKNLIVPGASIIVEGTTDNAFETTLTITDPTADRTITLPDATGTVALLSDISALIDSAPSALNTLNELAAAINDDPTYAVTIANALNDLGSNKQDKVTGVTSTQIGYISGLTSDVQAQLNAKQASVEGVGSTEIGYLAGVTSAIQTQLNAKSSTTALSNHESDTTNIHGIADTSALATKTDANTAASNAESNAITAAGIAAASAIATAVSNHEADTTNVHGITDTSVLTTASNTQTLTNKTLTSPKINENVALTTTATQLNYVSGVTSAIQTQLDGKSSTGHTHTSSSVTDFTEAAQDAVGNSLGSGLSYNDTTGAISVDTTTIQSRVANVSDTEIGYLDGVTSAIQTQLNAKLSLSGGTMTGALTLSGAPSSDLHAATKAYVDNITAGLNFHQPVRVATTANITLSGTQTIDGVSLSVGDRVLVKDQTTQTQNGIYVVASSTWSRATDADNTPDGELKGGDFTLVLEGTVNSGYGYVCSNTSAITIGTTNVTYSAFNAAKAVTAGSGLTESTPGTLDIATGGVTSAMIADGAIVDADINASAAIAQSKISGLTTDLAAKAPLASPTFTGTVTVSASGVAFTDGTQTKEGVPSRTTITQVAAAYNLSTGGLSLRDGLIEVSHTGGSAVDITIPTDATTNYPVGTSIDILRTNTGGVRVVAAAGATVNSTPGAYLRAQWSSATLFKRAANTWVLIGDLATA